MIAAIVFDFDGVLVDSEPLHLRAYQEVLAPFGTMSAEEYSTKYLGFDDEGVFRVFAEDRRLEMSGRQIGELIERKSQALERLVTAADILYPGADTCVERLAAAYPLGVASGALRHEIEAILGRYGLRRHFQFIVGAGDTPNSKPAPDPYRRAAELHGVPPQTCVAIEDSRWGLESARAAGLACIGITHTYPRGALSAADVVVDSLDELTVSLIAAMTSQSS